MNLALILIIGLLVLFFLISLNFSKVNFFIVFSTLIIFLRLSSVLEIKFLIFELNKLNISSVIIVLIFTLVVFKNIKTKIYSLFLGIFSLLSLNSMILFFLIFELFYFSFFILDKNFKFTNNFLNQNYLITSIIGISIYLATLYNTNLYLSIVCSLYLVRYFISTKYLFHNLKTSYLIYYLLVYQIILSNYIFINIELISFSKTFFILLISFFLLYNSITYINKKYFDNTVVLSNYSLLLILLSLYPNSFNILIFSYIVSFMLAYLLIFKINLNFFNFILLPVPASPLFYFEINLIKHLSQNIYTPLLAILFVFFMLYKIKNIDFFASKLQNIFKRE